MHQISDEFDRAIAATDAPVEKLSQERAAEIWRQLESCHVSAGTGPLWTGLRKRLSIHDPDGWHRALRIVGDSGLVLAEGPGEVSGFRYDLAVDARKVVEEMYLFVLYVVSEDLSVVAVHNDHDFLIVAGPKDPPEEP